MAEPKLLQITPDSDVIFDLAASVPTATLLLRNSGDSPVAFKVKTTVPEAYLVRPNLGLIGMRSSFEVVITLKPAKLQSGQKHKFSVQAVRTEISDGPMLAAMWNEARKEEVEVTVLKVVFEKKEEVAEGEKASLPKEPDKGSAARMSEYLNASLQYTELVKFNQQLQTEKLGLESELKNLQDLENEAASATKPEQGVAGKYLALAAAIGVLFGLLLFR